MIFSAIALVAFSFAGMANEIEEKKVDFLEETIQRDCFEAADLTLRIWDALYGTTYMTEAEEISWMNIYIALCEGYSESSIINY